MQRLPVGKGRLFTGALVALVLFGALLVRVAVVRHGDVQGVRHYYLGDDAMISMRYAYNLAHGRGFVWNPGEYVQGYTNLGWALVMAVVHWLGVPLRLAPLVVLLINVGVYLALLATLLSRLRPIPGLIAAALVALDGSLLAWTLDGFETTLQAIFITSAVLSFLGTDSPRLAPIWAALAFVVRPDALVVFAWAALLMVRRREFRWTLAAGAVLVVGVFVFQRVYYGDWLPNTFYLKATPGVEALGRGLHYLGRFALGDFFSFPLMLAPLALVILRRDLWAICALPILWMLCVVGLGGDVFEHGRFFAPIIPTLAVLTGLLIERLWLAARAHRAARYALVAVALMLAVHLARAIPLLVTTPGAFNAEPLMSALIAIPPGALIGVFAAGIVPYYLPDQRFHDFLGKSDRRIARSPAKPGPPGHNKWDYAYSLGEVRPDFLVTAPFGRTDEQYRSELAAGQDYGFHPALWLDERFHGYYRRFAGAPGDVRWIYARRDQHLSPR